MWGVGRKPKDSSGIFFQVCRRRGLKVIAGKSKVIVLDGEEGLEFEVCVDWMRLDHVSECKYFGCLWTNRVQLR